MEEIILHLVKCQVQFRFLHWQTMGDAQHRALGELYESFDEKLDEFVETMIGKAGMRPVFSPEFSLSLNDISSVSIMGYMDMVVEYLISLSDVFDPRLDSDLLNMRDELMGLVNHTKYLLTLKF